MGRVLIAEDEAALRADAVRLLQNAGFRVVQAQDGEEALALLRAHSDIGLLVWGIEARMDNYAQAIAGLALRPELKILLLAANVENPPPALLKAREVRILHKPFSLERLKMLVGDMMGRA